MGAFFICYRRDDTEDIVGRLYERLVDAYGRRRVFKDVYSIKAGTKFDVEIADALGRTDTMLVVVGKYWDVRRLHVADDWVHTEIRTALGLGIPIVPLFARGVTMPRPEDMPDDVRAFALFNGMPLRSDPDFDTDVARLLATFPAAWSRRRLAWMLAAPAVAVVAFLGLLVLTHLQTRGEPEGKGSSEAVSRDVASSDGSGRVTDDPNPFRSIGWLQIQEHQVSRREYQHYLQNLPTAERAKATPYRDWSEANAGSLAAVNWVSQTQAARYCEVAGGRLPTPEEWVKASGGDWGLDPTGSGIRGPWREWTSQVEGKLARVCGGSIKMSEGQRVEVLKRQIFKNTESLLAVTAVDFDPKAVSDPDIGFRCVK